jgi:hypothetical protein
VDQLCEEVCNFSYYFHNYKYYVLNLIYKLLDQDLSSQANQQIFSQVKRIVDFSRIDELMSQYVTLERAFLKNSIVKAIMQDNTDFITLVKANMTKGVLPNKAESGEQTLLMGKRESEVSGSSTEGGNQGKSLLDLIDGMNFIMAKCAKRSLMSLSLTNTCSVLNHINDLLQNDVMRIFRIRFYIFSGLIQRQDLAEKYRRDMQGQLNLHRIANLFEVTEKCQLEA